MHTLLETPMEKSQELNIYLLYGSTILFLGLCRYPTLQILVQPWSLPFYSPNLGNGNSLYVSVINKNVVYTNNRNMYNCKNLYRQIKCINRRWLPSTMT